MKKFFRNIGIIVLLSVMALALGACGNTALEGEFVSEDLNGWVFTFTDNNFTLTLPSQDVGYVLTLLQYTDFTIRGTYEVNNETNIINLTVDGDTFIEDALVFTRDIQIGLFDADPIELDLIAFVYSEFFFNNVSDEEAFDFLFNLSKEMFLHYVVTDEDEDIEALAALLAEVTLAELILERDNFYNALNHILATTFADISLNFESGFDILYYNDIAFIRR
ncbi:MAG: hypothetical protein FWE05_07040 [Defluviitaleaceae bacterium]|nr:hypothetical protein [Defluviitaleaceae bacterium]